MDERFRTHLTRTQSAARGIGWRARAVIYFLAAAPAVPTMAWQASVARGASADPVVSIHEVTPKPKEVRRRGAVRRRPIRTRVAGYRSQLRRSTRERTPIATDGAPARSQRLRVATENRRPATSPGAPDGRRSPVRPSAPGTAADLNDRGYRLLRSGRYAAAEPLLRRALALDPDYPHAQFNLGWSLLAQGKARDAVEPLRRSAAGESARWEPQQKLGEAYARIGDRDRSAAAYARSRALRRSPEAAVASKRRPIRRIVAAARARRKGSRPVVAPGPRNPRA